MRFTYFRSKEYHSVVFIISAVHVCQWRHIRWKRLIDEHVFRYIRSFWIFSLYQHVTLYQVIVLVRNLDASTFHLRQRSSGVVGHISWLRPVTWSCEININVRKKLIFRWQVTCFWMCLLDLIQNPPLSSIVTDNLQISTEVAIFSLVLPLSSADRRQILIIIINGDTKCGDQIFLQQIERRISLGLCVIPSFWLADDFCP